MNAKKCDRCGNYYDKDEGNYNIIKSNGLFVKDIDLCPECSQKLANWIEENNRTEGTTL